MPSKSDAQHRFMEAIAHSPKFARQAGVPQSVGKDFAAADKGKSFAAGGSTGALTRQMLSRTKYDSPPEPSRPMEHTRSYGSPQYLEGSGLQAALRGYLAGTAGLPGDIEGLLRAGINKSFGLGGVNVDPTPALPTTEFYKDWLPGKQLGDEAINNLASLFGGIGSTKLAKGALTLLGDLLGGPVGRSAQRGVFGGIGAKTADLGALDIAKQRITAGDDPAKVFGDTGWMKFGDKWSFEIPDNNSISKSPSWGAMEDLKSGNSTTDIRQRVFPHPKLSAAYPETKSIPIMLNPRNGDSGSYGGDLINSISVGASKENGKPNRSVLLHELNHAIQDIEGFPRGGSPSMMVDYRFNPELKALQDQRNELSSLGEWTPDIGKQYVALNKKEEAITRNPYNSYQRLAGEAQSRLAQARMDMTPEQLRAQYPLDPEYFKKATGVSLDDLIYKYGGDGPSGMITWHGSPHQMPPTAKNPFGEFDASKIGTGEGAQSYGKGHYTAQAKGVGNEYAGDLSAARATKPVGNVDLTQAYQNLAGDVPASLMSARNDFRELRDMGALTQTDRRDFLTAVKNNLTGQQGGNLYKVHTPDEEIAKFLDWDKPLSDQSQHVQNLAKQITPENFGWKRLEKSPWIEEADNYSYGHPDHPRVSNYMIPLGNDATGKDLYEMARSITGSYEKATPLFSGNGIPGIRYLDGGSRGAGAGTSNFVTFPGNENLMTILERNGEKVPLALKDGKYLDRHDELTRKVIGAELEQAGERIYPQSVDIEIARRNGVANGLPEGNTAMDRAAAQGWDTDAYHSSLGDLTAFDPTGKFMGHQGISGISVTDNPEMASRYLDRYNSQGWVNGVPHQPFSKNILPLKIRQGNTLETDISPYKIKSILGSPLPSEYTNPMLSDGIDTLIVPDSISRKGIVKHSDAKNAVKGNEMIIANPNQIRSSFAAFDPARINEDSLLAGALPLSAMTDAKDNTADQTLDGYAKGGLVHNPHGNTDKGKLHHLLYNKDPDKITHDDRMFIDQMLRSKK